MYVTKKPSNTKRTMKNSTLLNFLSFILFIFLGSTSLEAQTPIGPDLVVNPGLDTDLSGWNPTGNVSQGSFAGLNNVAFFSSADSAVNGILTQDFTTTVGETYFGSFDYAFVDGNGPGIARVLVQVYPTGNPGAPVFSQTFEPPAVTNIRELREFVFTANNTGMTISFTDQTTTTTNTDLAIDNLSVRAIATPGGVAGSDLWLKADTDAAPALWEDQSGNDHDVTAVAGQQPVLETNSLNFNPVMDFDGTNDQMTNLAAPFASGLSNETNIFLVAREDVRQANSIFGFSDGDFARYHSHHIYPDGNIYFDIISSVGDNRVSGPSGLTAGEPHVASYFNSISNTNQAIDINGAVIASDATGESQSLGVTRIGSAINAGAPSYFNGDIAEFIAYDTDNGATNKQQIQSYLAIKYGITLDAAIVDYVDAAGSSVYNLATYPNDVFGIAKDDDSSLDQQISKSVNTGAVLTLSNDTNFTGANGTHASLTDGQFLVIGNDGASGAVADAIATDLDATKYFTRAAREWKSVNTGTVGTVNLQFDDYDDTWILLTRTTDGDFSATTGTTETALSAAGTVSLALPGTTYFTLAQKTTSIEFELATANDVEATGGNLPSLLLDGTLHTDTNIDVVINGASTATLGTDFTFGGNTAALPQTIGVSIPAGTYTAATPLALAGLNLAPVNQFNENYPSIVNDGLIQEGLKTFTATTSGTYSLTLSAATFSSSGAGAPEGFVTVGTSSGSNDVFDGFGDPITETTSSKTYTFILVQGTTYFFRTAAFGDTTLTDVNLVLDSSPGAVSFAITDESLVEADETIDISLSNAQPGLTIQEVTSGTLIDTHIYTITNDDELTVDFDSATYSEDEDAGTITLNLTVSGAEITAAETIDIDVTGGTATIVTDYTFADPTTVTIPVDDYTTAGTVSVDITLIDNEVIEADETIELALINPSGNVSLGTTQATTVATITNDDAIIIEFVSNASASTDEATADNLPQFYVKGETPVALTFDLVANPASTATAADYGFTFPITVTIPANTSFDGTTATSLDLSGITLVDDDLVEGDETVVFIFDNLPTGVSNNDANGDTTLNFGNAYTITDDDVAAFTVTPTNLTVPENAGTGTFTVVLDAQPLTDVAFSVVSSAVGEGTVDLSTLTFTNANWDTPQTVTVTGIDNSAIGDNTSIITISVTDAASDDAFDALSDQAVNTTFTDDDIPNLSVVATNTTAPEGTTETFTVVLTAQPATDVVVTVVSSDTAEATVAIATLTFTNANWDTPQTVTVQSVEDTNLGDDTADITMAIDVAGSDAAYAAVASQATSYTFTNNDVEVTISASSSDVEAIGGNLPVLLINGTTTVASTITVSVTGGDAVAGSDFAFTSPQVVNVPAATYDGTAATGIAITGLSITDENAVEPNETIDFELSAPTGQLVLGADTTSTYTINNDDSVTVEFNSAAANDAEATGGNLPTLFLTGEVVNASTINVALDVSSTATVGSDFIFTSVQVVNIPTGVYDGTSATAIAIPTLGITDDSFIDANETIVLNLETPTGDLSLGTVTQHIYTITDDETVGFTVSETALTLAEDGGVGTFTVVLTAQPVTDVVIDINSDDTLEATTDVTSLTFNTTNWNTPQTVTVTGVNDNVIAADTATITAAINAAGSDDDFDALADQTVAITLTDDDTAGFTVSPLALIVNENGGTGTFTVVLNTQPDSDVVFDITSLDILEATVDLSVLTFTNANWDTPQTITVTGVDDPAVVDQSTSITVAVNDAGSDDNFDSLADQTVTVDLPNEDIVVGPTLTTAGPYVVDENAGTVTVGVVLGSQPITDVVIDYVVSDPLQGTTSVVQMTFTNANWNISQPITFTGIDDTDITGDFDITVTATVNDALSDDSFDGGQITATMTIIDDDFTNLAVSIAAGTAASEPATDGDFIVSVVSGALNSTGAAITGDIAYSGVAADGTDFNGDATYSIADGTSSATVTIAAANDFEIEGDETIIATISNPSVGTINVDNATITLSDDDSIDVAATGTEITTTDGAALANGTETETVSVQLKDAAGNNLVAAGVQVTFALTGSATATSLTAVTDANGLAQIDITNTIAETVQVTATVDTDNNVSTAEVAVVNGSPASVVFSVDNSNPDGNNGNTTITAISPVVADGTATSTVTVTLADANGNLLTAGGATVVLTTTGSATQVGLVNDEGDGTYTATFSNTVAETVTITGTVNGQAILDDATIEFTSDNSNPSVTNTNTTIAATSPVVADGSATSTVTVTLADANGNLLTGGGATVVVTSTGNATQVGTVVDNADGTYTATFSNTTAETVTISATVGGNAITTGDASVVFEADNTNPAAGNVNTTIAATNPVVADGTATTTVTVTLADTNGNLLTVGGATVVVTATGDATQVGTVIDNGDGTYTAYFSNTSSETVTISATVDGNAITTGDASVVFEADNSNPSATNVNTTITATGPVDANGTDVSTVTVQLADANGNLITSGGEAVVLAVTGNAILVSGVTDNGNGTYTATYSNLLVESVTVTGTLNGTNITDDTTISFALDTDPGCTVNCDTDGDGTCDLNCDTDGDGTPDVNVDTDNDGTCDLNCDTDGDGTPDTNIDTDGDGTPDVNVDTDNDGTCDLNCDTDGDGTPDTNIDTDGDGTPDVNIDTDNDGVCDLNCDTDGDGTPDTNIDTDGDGTPDVNIDTDNDGTCDLNCDTDGDGTPDTNIDTDGDGTPDVNVDTDNDGTCDLNCDTDGDGTPDTNIDTDGDGECDANCDKDGEVGSISTINPAQAFTPNGDGINDAWVIEGIENYPNNVVKVYNRSGHEVFSAGGYQNNWEAFYKDNSEKLPPGSYYYVIDLGDGGTPQDGWIFINY